MMKNLSNILDIYDAIERWGILVNCWRLSKEIMISRNLLIGCLDPKEDIEIKDGILVITNPAQRTDRNESTSVNEK